MCTEYVPTVFENKVVPLEVNGSRQHVAVWDTAGQEDFDRIRALFYHEDARAFYRGQLGWLVYCRRAHPDARRPKLLSGLKAHAVRTSRWEGPVGAA